jgi:zinc transport system permease protein
MSLVAEMFSYPFMVRACIVGTLVALCAALLGVSLVLKRYSMIGDGLSHVAFGALAVASVTHTAPLAVSIPVVMIAAFLLLRLSEGESLRGDAAVALVASASLAIGVFVISMSSGMNTDVNNYLFGSILGMSDADMMLSVAVSFVVLVLFTVFYHRIFAVTFDEAFARATGVNAGAYTTLIALLTALVIIVGMRLVGALLISSLIVFPPLTSMRVHKSFKRVTVSSAVLSVLCLWVGLVVSYVFSTPTGASIVLCNVVAFCVHWLWSALRSRRKESS